MNETREKCLECNQKRVFGQHSDTVFKPKPEIAQQKNQTIKTHRHHAGQVLEVNESWHLLQHRQEARQRVREGHELVQVEDHPLVDVGTAGVFGEGLGPALAIGGQLVGGVGSTN